MAESKYLVGIDLGTSNCAVAFVDPEGGPLAPVLDFPIMQLHRAGELAQLPLLPSALYLPGEHELPPGAITLPWDPIPEMIIGEFARWQGSRVPGRLVTSAKSWLCNAAVDRGAPILPWGSPAEVRKVSPVDASARLLMHIREAWNAGHPEHPLATQQVVITVPASFDEAARSLTANAAVKAGFQQFTLLEEPQAAFYDFIARHRGDLVQALQHIRLVLVIDVGGGTSDFTLIQAAVGPDGPALRRIAVGDHLMLGGDNMDAALGRTVETRMLSGGRRLSTMQWSQLLQASRIAKESLLKEPRGGETAPGRHNLTIAGEGSRLIGSALSAQLTRAEAEKMILEGFFPMSASTDRPQGQPRMALQELGLPYAQDPAVTRHIAAFLANHAKAAFEALEQPVSDALPRPDAILLNGGVFNSGRIASRLVDAVSRWWPEHPAIPLLHHDSLDLAVARGAAYYGLVRHGLGTRIGGGAAHALYLGLETTDASKPAALCVLPRGHEEGQSLEITGRTFQLTIDKPVRFPLFSTAADRVDKAGDIVSLSDDLMPLPPIHTLLKSSRVAKGAVPVHLQVTLTEIGTLELWCVSNEGKEKWRLEFELRGSAAEPSFSVTAPMPAGFGDARSWIEIIYGTKRRQPTVPLRNLPAIAGTAKYPPPKDVKQLWPSLERALGAREYWGLPLLRELWGALLAAAAKRRRSPEHERVYYQLLGFCLRPGFGYPLDEWRCEQSASLFAECVQFHQEQPIWKEFWILWRRLAGGLNEERHREIWDYLKPHLAVRIPPGAKRPARQKGIQPDGLDEMARLAASLEHLEAGEKTTLGDWIGLRLRQPATATGPWTWTLGRIGTRVPIFGSAHRVVSSEKVSAWVEELLRPDVLKLEGALFALTQMTRMTGDRHRDVSPELRLRALEALRQGNAPNSWQRMLQEVVTLEAADRARAFGDTLPVGLILAESEAGRI